MIKSPFSIAVLENTKCSSRLQNAWRRSSVALSTGKASKQALFNFLGNVIQEKYGAVGIVCEGNFEKNNKGDQGWKEIIFFGLTKTEDVIAVFLSSMH